MNAPSNAPRLFAGSCLALVVIGLTFAIRGDIIGDLGTRFNLTHEQLGWIAGAAFWGYVVSIVIAGQLCDLFGMRRLLLMAVRVGSWRENTGQTPRSASGLAGISPPVQVLLVWRGAPLPCSNSEG